MWRGLMAVGGAALGGAFGLFAPVLVLRLLNIGSGSYEDVLLPWLLAVPGGVSLGAWAGFRLGRRLEAR